MIRSVRSNGSQQKSLISYSYGLTRTIYIRRKCNRLRAPAVYAACYERDRVSVSVDTIGESVDGIQRRRATHPLRCRRKANDALGRGQTHRPIHVYGSWSICRDHRWKLPGISFNPNVETPSCRRCYRFGTFISHWQARILLEGLRIALSQCVFNILQERVFSLLTLSNSYFYCIFSARELKKNLYFNNN